MKRSDIYTLILIAGIGTLAAFFACNAILGDPNKAKVEFKGLSKVLTSDLASPNNEIFNGMAINPTVEVYVGDCEDIDRNGLLDKAELIACGREQAPEEDKEDEDVENEDGEVNTDKVEDDSGEE